MIKQQQQAALDLRYARIRELEVELAGHGYHVVTAVTVEDVAQRLADRAEDMVDVELLTAGQVRERQIDPDDFDTLNYIALQAAFLLSENHLDNLPVDYSLDKAIETKVRDLEGR